MRFGFRVLSGVSALGFWAFKWGLGSFVFKDLGSQDTCPSSNVAAPPKSGEQCLTQLCVTKWQFEG